nr:MAG TPA: pentapeptide repeat protein [Ackermannviridae sp.]
MRKFTSDELQQVLHEHAQWIKSCGKSGKRANLRWANLSGADLSGADLRGANLRGANLSGADLSWADLSVANLSVANLSGADLRGADLSGANLRGADLRGADLSVADLSVANLSGANLSGANDLFTPMACPSDGAFIAWKKCCDDLIVKLLIPEDARRLSAAGRKCRCDKAMVLEIQNLDGTNAGTTAYSTHTENFAYVVGQTVTPDSFCEDRWQECSSGIHFFITREEAVRY